MFISFPTHLCSSLVMDRQSTSTSVYNNNDEFDAMKNHLDAKMDKHLEELKSLMKTGKRSSSSSRRRSSAHASELPSPARSHRHRHHHRQQREDQELNTNLHSTTSPSTLASSPSDFKASSPLDMGHLRRQAPQDYAQEKLPKLKSATSMSYYDLDTDHEIPFYGTHDPDEYLEWERKMDDYLKLHQVRSEDQVKCATSNFHDYASTWWPHTPLKSFNMSWPKTKKAMRREFMPFTYTEHLQRQLENTIQGSKSLDEYFKEMKKALRQAGVDDPIWMKFYFMMGLNNHISKTIFLDNYESLDDIYFGALKAEQEHKKAKASPPQAHFAMTKLHDGEHEDSTTMMSKPDELQDDAPKFDFTDIPLCGIDNAESTTTLFEDGAVTTTTTEPLKEQDLEASDKVASKDDASIFGGENEMIEHGIFPSVMEANNDVPSSAFIHGDIDDDLNDMSTYIESESEFTTSPVYDELPHVRRATTPTT